MSFVEPEFMWLLLVGSGRWNCFNRNINRFTSAKKKKQKTGWIVIAGEKSFPSPKRIEVCAGKKRAKSGGIRGSRFEPFEKKMRSRSISTVVLHIPVRMCVILNMAWNESRASSSLVRSLVCLAISLLIFVITSSSYLLGLASPHN